MSAPADATNHVTGGSPNMAAAVAPMKHTAAPAPKDHTVVSVQQTIEIMNVLACRVDDGGLRIVTLVSLVIEYLTVPSYNTFPQIHIPSAHQTAPYPDDASLCESYRDFIQRLLQPAAPAFIFLSDLQFIYAVNRLTSPA